MRAEQLRIGNLIYVNGNAEKVTDILRDHGQYYIETHLSRCISWKEIKPIPLTEEWLLKFGFEMFDYDFYDDDGEEEIYTYYYIKHHKFEYRVNTNPDGIYEFTIKWEWASEGVLSYIQYVYQLQNVYFALTGKELELNQTP